MIKFSKNVRVLLYALALSAFTCGGLAAQEATAPTPTAAVDIANGRLSLTTEEGTFKSEFKSFLEAYEASQGNSYNKPLKNGNEIIVMNARCGDDPVADKVTFSLYRIDSSHNKDLEPVIKSYLDYRQTNPKTLYTPDAKQRERVLIDEVMRILAVSSFPRKAECDPVPIALSLPFGVLRLEADDSQSPLVGPKFNDGFLYDALSQNYGLMTSTMATKRDFWERYGYNRFSTAQDALNAAGLMAGIKVIIFNGTNFSLYRLGDFKPDYKLGDTQFDVFKSTPIREGWKIVAIVRGKDLIRIYEPNAK